MSPIDPNAALPLISFERVMADDVPPVAWLVDPLIAEGDRVIVYGEFGSMKSWLLLDLSLHVAAGHPWFGKFPIPAAKSVLFIDEEMNERTLRRRMKRLALGAGLEAQKLPFQVASRVGVTFGPNGAKNLLAALGHAGFDPDIIVVETWRRVQVGSENEAKDVVAFWRNVEPLLKAGKTLIVSHHMRKPKSKRESQRDRASGSTDILAGTDSALAVQRTKPGVVRVECVKSREAEEAAAFVVRLTEESKDGPVRLVCDTAPAEEPEADLGKLAHAKSLIVEALKSWPERTAETEMIETELDFKGIAKRTGQRALEALREERRVDQPTRGTWRLVKE